MTAIFWSCEPERDDEFSLNGNPPEAKIEVTAIDGNTYIFKDLTPGSFQRLWSFPGGIPANSNTATDTVFFPKKGIYEISLYVSQSNGSGTSTVSLKVDIAENGALTCTDKIALLTGDCFPAGKCWTLTREAGAVKVGPSYSDFSWYTSPAGGLQDAQYDDGFCFTFDGLTYENRNNGASVDPWDGYKAIAYNPGITTFVFSEGTGNGGKDQIIIPDEQFMGVWDSDNVMDIVELSETKLITRARLRGPNGVPAAEGWFELVFVRK